MNGFELAGRPMKVNNVTDRHEFSSSGPSIDETDERAGIDLGATGRLQLMYKLAEGKRSLSATNTFLRICKYLENISELSRWKKNAIMKSSCFGSDGAMKILASDS